MKEIIYKFSDLIDKSITQSNYNSDKNPVFLLQLTQNCVDNFKIKIVNKSTMFI